MQAVCATTGQRSETTRRTAYQGGDELLDRLTALVANGRQLPLGVRTPKEVSGFSPASIGIGVGALKAAGVEVRGDPLFHLPRRLASLAFALLIVGEALEA